jgi:hypothetical protein
MRRLLSPATNPAGLAAALAALYALAQVIFPHLGVTLGLSQAQLSLIAAGVALLIRQVVTPVKDPRISVGSEVVPLKTAGQHAAANFARALGSAVEEAVAQLAQPAPSVTTSGPVSPQPAPPEGGTAS